MPKTQRKLTTIYTSLEETDCAVFDSIARTKGLSRSELARQALRQFVDAQEQVISDGIETKLRKLISEVVENSQYQTQNPLATEDLPQPNESQTEFTRLLEHYQDEPLILSEQQSTDINQSTESDYGHEYERSGLPDSQNRSDTTLDRRIEEKLDRIIAQISAAESPANSHQPINNELIQPGQPLTSLEQAPDVQQERRLETLLNRVLDDRLKSPVDSQLDSSLERILIQTLKKELPCVVSTELENNLDWIVAQVLGAVMGTQLDRSLENSMTKVLDNKLKTAIVQLDNSVEQIMSRVLEKQLQVLSAQINHNLNQVTAQTIEAKLLQILPQCLSGRASEETLSALAASLRNDLWTLETRVGTLAARMSVDTSIIFLLLWNTQSNDRFIDYEDLHHKSVKRINRWLAELGMNLPLEAASHKGDRPADYNTI